MPNSGLAVLLLSALTIPGFDRVLLPLHNGDTEGAGGSRWRVEEIILNQSDEPADFYPYFFLGSWFEATVGTLTPRSTLAPEEISQPEGCRGSCRPPPHPGGIIYVRSEHRNRLVMYNRVHEERADRDNRGAVVPAIHESDFRHGRTTFPSVPIGENFRSTLRLYNMGSAGIALSVRVVRRGNDGDVELAAVRVSVPASHSQVSQGPHAVPLLPGYRQITVESLLSHAETEPVDVIIESAEPSPVPEYWTFLSVTSHSTQRVTVFTPSP